MRDQYQGFSVELLRISEIGTNPVAEVLCLADIDNPAACIPELVDAR